jgi:DNA-binding NarL/FixJ family response regulator
LESLAKAKGVSTTVALHQLLEAGTRHLSPADAPPTRPLSKKQVSVLESLQAGQSVKEIAVQLGVSEGTVRTHIHRIRSHLKHSDLLSLRFH